MKQIVYSILFIALAACNRHAIPGKQVSEHTTDSSSEKTVTKFTDTTVKVKGEQLTMKAFLPCPNAIYFNEIKGQRVNLTTSVKDGQLTVKCEADSLALLVRFLQSQLTTVTSMKQQLKVEKIPYKVEVEVAYIPKWFKWILAISIGLNGFCYRATILKLVMKWKA